MSCHLPPPKPGERYPTIHMVTDLAKDPTVSDHATSFPVGEYGTAIGKLGPDGQVAFNFWVKPAGEHFEFACQDDVRSVELRLTAQQLDQLRYALDLAASASDE